MKKSHRCFFALAHNRPSLFDSHIFLNPGQEKTGIDIQCRSCLYLTLNRQCLIKRDGQAIANKLGNVDF